MKKVLLTTILALASTSALANENTGCGLGSQIFEQQDTIVTQVLAATTNGSYGNQTFGISSGTSGCTAPATFASNEKAKSFIANNMDSLALDIATGSGESIDTLAVLLDVEDKASFKTKLQNNFASIYSSSDVNAAHVIDTIAAVAG